MDSVNTYKRVNRLIVLTSGSSNTAFNAGTLSVAHKTTTANIFIVAPVGSNQSQVGAYTIPNCYTGYLRYFVVEMSRANTATAAGNLWIRENGASPRLRRPFSLSNEVGYKDEIYGGILLPEKTDIAVRMLTVSANNTDIIANFDIVLRKNNS